MEPIAIVGIGCRFPEAKGPAGYWKLLCDGVDAIGEVPADRWNVDDFYDPNPAAPGKTNSRWGGFIGNINEFDWDFFGISSREAEAMDPQHRLLLEVAWEALEDAGQDPERLEGSGTGVFVGIMYFDHGNRRMSNLKAIDAFLGTSVSLGISANRLSYFFDFRGPSLAIDTACSSSAVAAHMACESLRRGECNMALAGGVSLMLSPASHIFFTKAGAMAPDGRCKTFDARANGIVRGEGAGLVVLKTLSQALKDCDQIYALIIGSALNQDGRSNGLMAPNGPAQEALLKQAYQNAGVSPAQAQYVELHGTGTLLGDPIEAKALGKALAEGRPPGSLCAVGSVKTNIGHLEPAAGIAGLIKVALMFRHGEIPASLHYQTPNPHIPFDRLPIRINQELTRFPTGQTPAIAGVSSFGFGGTNVHLVLQKYEPGHSAQPATPDREQAAIDRSYLLPLSARDVVALREMAGRFSNLLKREDRISLRDVCYSASVRRGRHDHRLAVVATDRDHFISRLEAYARDGCAVDITTGHRNAARECKVLFVFSGQGPQYWAMGRKLLEEEKVFRDSVEECDRHFAAYANWSLLGELTSDASHSRLNETSVAQPALFALQVGLTALWRSWGVKPAAVIGHSLGEVAAAYQAGALSLEDALWIVYHRARLMQRATGKGRMAVVELAASDAVHLAEKFTNELSVAAMNGPRSSVLSGDSDALVKALSLLDSQGIYHQLLPVDYAFHSSQMTIYREELLESLKGIQPRPARIPLWSTVAGGLVKGEALEADHWARQLVLPVLFDAALKGATQKKPDAILEIGPHPVLAAEISACLGENSGSIPVVPSLRRNENDRTVMLTSLGSLYAKGAQVNWDALYPSGGRMVSLPSYPWQRRLCATAVPSHLGVDDPSIESGGRLPRQPHALLRGRTALMPSGGVSAWEFNLDLERAPYLLDHRIQGALVMAGPAYVEMAIAAAVEVFGQTPLELSGLCLNKALFLDPDRDLQMQVVLKEIDLATGRQATFNISSRLSTEGAWTSHAEGTIRPIAPVKSNTSDLPAARLRCSQEFPTQTHYSMLAERGFDYGESFQAIRSLWKGDRESLARVELSPELIADPAPYHLHPVLLDTSMQVLMAALPKKIWEKSKGGSFMPDAAGNVRLYSKAEGPLWNQARVTAASATVFEGDVRYFDDRGALVLEVLKLRGKRLDREPAAHSEDSVGDWLYQLRWTTSEDPLNDAAVIDVCPEARWLLLADSQGTADALADLLTGQDKQCLRIYQGEGFKRLDATRFSIDPANPENIARLFEEFHQSKIVLQGVAHLWGFDSTATANGAVEAQRLCAGLLHTVQALARFDQEQPFKLWLITAGAQAVSGQEGHALKLAQAPLWGLGRGISEEHPAFWGGSIDLPPDATPSDAARILAPLIPKQTKEDQYAFRDGRAYVSRLFRFREKTARLETLPLRKDASYLITGGLGGLGLALAGRLVENGVRRLVLLSRTGLPPRKQWKDAVPDTLQARRIAAVRSLERAGASIHLPAVDVADPNQLKTFFDEFRDEGWPQIRGVVHAAGAPGQKSLADLDQAALAEVMRPKVHGAWLLHQFLQDDELDFFVLMSSAASLLRTHAGGLGPYAAANSFLDALAHYRRAAGRAGISINWGPWSEVGMAKDMAEALRQRGIGGIPTLKGVEAFDRVLLLNPEQIAVMPMDWKLWLQAHPAASNQLVVKELLEEDTLRATSQTARADSAISSHLRETDPEQAQAFLEAFLIQKLEGLLHRSSDLLSLDEPLINLGLNSLAAVELKNAIERELQVIFPMVEIMKGPSIRQLASAVLKRLTSGEIHPAGPSIAMRAGSPPGVSADNPRELIERIDELPPDQLDLLLTRLLEEQEADS